MIQQLLILHALVWHQSSRNIFRMSTSGNGFITRRNLPKLLENL